MQVSLDQFGEALKEASSISEEELLKRSGAVHARSYFMLYKNRRLPMKAVARLAYKNNNQVWDGLHSKYLADVLRERFKVEHKIECSGKICEKTERARLKNQKELIERWARPEQAKFRAALLKLYERCAVSGCQSLDALDAAHIKGIGGENNKLSNGIILRADLHRLFDAGLMAINPKTGAVCFASTCKKDYAKLHGRKIVLPLKGPKFKKFRKRWDHFKSSLS